ncbi:muramoyltetrapeptide carboxypeptidase LdcA involved in peptidoglycan recycling [Stackebrandtia endophytica]|uniref:Muramoyltetrapeptide carboxypeptidase LdcA involved in peptidoglycan recycling n=1 Tax=Stackebrandtia endophytica TaxID=1496996 RepID=A0A543ASU5_9ACTN|nr:S66 peptidase family protein [Stackebrandtia endophytica]TQL75647.1 muramoyltetrapeptide carboxypeptidase LdcA involved in peptidoglycan recycling [Stackebrandtia endophytica]
MIDPVYPVKVAPGDRVAILSPAAGLPGILPLPFDLGLKRLAEDFDLVPVEYPTTRRMGSTAADRAADLHAAFADPTITAVICSIGGDDSITVLPHLDPEIFRANPKPFFGFSDCSTLLAFLDELGVVGYHGGAVMTAFGRPGAMDPLTEESLRAALFTSGEYRLRPADGYTDIGRDWADPATFDAEPDTMPGSGWEWIGPQRSVTGRGWGGCLEVLAFLLMADRCIPTAAEFSGRVLFLETSEMLPSADEVYWILRSMGERGILAQVGAFLMGRPKAWSFDKPNDADARQRYVTEQAEAVRRALTEYAPDTPAVLNLDIGHTDPQVILPYGGQITVDGVSRLITVSY